jgi:hypothetical protein
MRQIFRAKHFDILLRKELYKGGKYQRNADAGIEEHRSIVAS